MSGHLTYFAFETLWALPVLAVQWLVGFKVLWRRRCVLVLCVGASTAYLSVADGAAIAQGIWTLHASRISGFRLGDVPVEETIFFGLTNAMVVQSILLVLAWRQRSAPRA